MNELSTYNQIKPKSIIINGDIHNEFKLLCKRKNLKIGGVIEELIKLYLNNTREIQKMVDEYKDKERENLELKKIHDAMKK